MLFIWNGTNSSITIDSGRVEIQAMPIVNEVIPFYIPPNYKPKDRYVLPRLRGKILEFKPKEKK